MKSVKLTNTLLIASTLALSVGASACGRSDLGRSSSQVFLDRLEAAPGNKPTDFGATLLSDVITKVKRTVNGQQIEVDTIYNDFGKVTLRAQLRDPGTPASPSQPTTINSVTFTRYHVTYVRADGRNTQGIDVPYAFDSAATVTVPANGSAEFGFELVRHTAKEESPLAALRNNPTIISTIAEITFYGKDLAGNEVIASGTMGVNFGNFADPE